MSSKKVLIFIVTYNAESTIENVLSRIPNEVLGNQKYDTSILIIDDSSIDKTFKNAYEYKNKLGLEKIKILFNPINLGYGGNQKVGYHYAIQNKFDIVALLHGDGQYAPEELPRLLNPLINDQADVVFGSRMLSGLTAIKGGMPLYKFLGNRVLTFMQNLILGSKLSEFHSGYRLYNVRALESIPFDRNSNDFDFDTDIIIQFLQRDYKIVEIPTPTFYGDEICNVNGLKYAFNVIKSSILSKFQKLGIFYHPKFDFITENLVYEGKFGYSSSHQLAYEFVENDDNILDIGSGPGPTLKKITKKTAHITAIDQYCSPEVNKYCESFIEADLEHFDFSKLNSTYNKILMLDIIEHMNDPEDFLFKLREAFQNNPQILITSGNIGFIINRIMLLFGYFNYGKMGILDRTHSRLFTFRSLGHILRTSGFEVISERGIPAPYPKAIGLNYFSKLLLKLNEILIRISRGLFSYQIAFIVTPLPNLNQLLKAAENEANMLTSKNAVSH